MAATSIAPNGNIHLLAPLRAHLGLTAGEPVVLYILRDGRVMLETPAAAARRRRTSTDLDADDREFTAVITSAGDIRLPEGIRRQLGADVGSPLTLRLLRDGRVHVERAIAGRVRENTPIGPPRAVTSLGVGVDHDIRTEPESRNFSRMGPPSLNTRR